MPARRIGLLFGCFFVLLGIAGVRTAYLATVKGDTLKRAAATQQIDDSTVPARRGTILDREGVELAVSEAADDVHANPLQVEDAPGTARKLASILRRPEDDVLRKLVTQGKGFVYLARAVPSARADRIAKLKLPGIGLTPTVRRVYPRDWMGSQVLGSVGIDNQGLSGLEYRFDDQLRGTDGRRRIVRDALGQALSVRDVKAAVPGEKLELSLDANIQDQTEQVLGEIGAKWKPNGATAVVMNPNTGELLAVANWPRINANAPAQAPDYATQNRAVSYTYEPGSTFKAFTVAGALEENKVTPTTTFNLPPKITRYDRTVGESHRTEAVTYNTKQILSYSSNVGAIKIGEELGPDDFAKWVERFGFGQRTGVDLPGEERGIVRPRSEYYGTSMVNLPIGQGETVTPIQLAAGYAAIANGGRRIRPHIVRRVGDRLVPGRPGKRIISERTAAELRSMLKGVFDPSGTAAEVSVKGYKLAGKTGTANKIDPKTGEYSSSRYVASFVGFAPAHRPKLLVSVMLDEPQGGIYGGEVAAPAFGEIMSFALSYLKIPPS